MTEQMWQFIAMLDGFVMVLGILAAEKWRTNYYAMEKIAMGWKDAALRENILPISAGVGVVPVAETDQKPTVH